MKTLKANWMILIGLSISLSSFGAISPVDSTENRVGIIPKGDNVYSLIYKASEAGKVKVSIYNSQGNVIYSEIHHQVNGFARPYNFKELPYGKYTIQTVDGKGSSECLVNHQKAYSQLTVRIMKVPNQDNKYLVMASGTNENIQLNIYDAVNQLIYNESIRMAGNFGQLYSLPNIKGGCAFEVIHQNGSVQRMQYP